MEGPQYVKMKALTPEKMKPLTLEVARTLLADTNKIDEAIFLETVISIIEEGRSFVYARDASGVLSLAAA